MNDIDARVAEHRCDQAGDTADHVNASLDLPVLAAQRLELVDQCLYRSRVVVDPTVDQHPAVVGADRSGPVKPLRDVDADRDAHLPPLRRTG